MTLKNNSKTEKKLAYSLLANIVYSLYSHQPSKNVTLLGTARTFRKEMDM